MHLGRGKHCFERRRRRRRRNTKNPASIDLISSIETVPLAHGSRAEERGGQSDEQIFIAVEGAPEGDRRPAQAHIDLSVIDVPREQPCWTVSQADQAREGALAAFQTEGGGAHEHLSDSSQCGKP